MKQGLSTTFNASRVYKVSRGVEKEKHVWTFGFDGTFMTPHSDCPGNCKFYARTHRAKNSRQCESGTTVEHNFEI